MLFDKMLPGREYAPQRLKPLSLDGACGTAEAVSLRKSVVARCATGSEGVPLQKHPAINDVMLERDARMARCGLMNGAGGDGWTRAKLENYESTPRAAWESRQSGVKPPHSQKCQALVVAGFKGRTRRGWAAAGFTLIELMIVITIMLILIGMAAVRYDRSVLHSKEAALHHDLSVMREAIEQYTLDKEQAPQSLDDLVSAGYLRAIPTDPVTGGKDWVTDTSDAVLDPDQSSGGISDVHSSSPAVSPFENTPYNTW